MSNTSGTEKYSNNKSFDVYEHKFKKIEEELRKLLEEYSGYGRDIDNWEE